MKHLWEVDHPYYCQEGNFFKVGYHENHEARRTRRLYIREVDDRTLGLRAYRTRRWRKR